MGRAVLDLVISYALSTSSMQSSALAARDTAKMRACLPSRCWQSIRRCICSKWENCPGTGSLEPDSNGSLYEESLLDSMIGNKSYMKIKKAGLDKMN